MILSPMVFRVASVGIILLDKAITMISRMAATINSIGSLAHAVNGEWGDLASYGKEVLEVMWNACLQATLEKCKLK